jgi:uncharacterized membrane protein
VIEVMICFVIFWVLLFFGFCYIVSYKLMFKLLKAVQLKKQIDRTPILLESKKQDQLKRKK